MARVKRGVTSHARHKKTLDKLAEALLERESLGGHEVDVIVFGKFKADEIAKKEEKAKEAAMAEEENSIKAKSESKTPKGSPNNPQTIP